MIHAAAVPHYGDGLATEVRVIALSTEEFRALESVAKRVRSAER